MSPAQHAMSALAIMILQKKEERVSERGEEEKEEKEEEYVMRNVLILFPFPTKHTALPRWCLKTRGRVLHHPRRLLRPARARIGLASARVQDTRSAC